MLPPASPLTLVTGASWSALGVPPWVTRCVLTAGWAAALVAAMVGDSSRCTPDNPAICGSDQGFAWWVVICVATPLLLIWLPLMGCAAGVAFALADLAYDDVTSANIGFGLHGIACAVVAVWLLRSAAGQERVVADTSGGIRASVPSTHSCPDTRWNWARLVAAGILVLAGAALIGWYTHDLHTEQSHLAAAERVTGRVVAADDENYTIALDAAAAAGSRQVKTGVLDPQLYPIGSTTPVLLDPGDLSWSRLVAEPQDATGWESGGLLALLLALLLVMRELQARRARQLLWTGEHPALRVWVIPDEVGDALVLPDDGARPDVVRGEPVARLPLAFGPWPADADEDDRDEDDEALTDSCLGASGADVVQEPTEQPYGVRDCAFRDPAGNLIRINELR